MIVIDGETPIAVTGASQTAGGGVAGAIIIARAIAGAAVSVTLFECEGTETFIILRTLA